MPANETPGGVLIILAMSKVSTMNFPKSEKLRRWIRN